MVNNKPPSRAAARRQAMLEAATALFLEKGFDATTLSDILERSGGSRTTFYAQFGGKDGMLRTIIEESTAAVWEKVRWKDGPPPLTEEELVEYGCVFSAAVSDPDVVAVYRIVFAESRRIPGVAELFMDSGPKMVFSQLTEWFSAALETGRLKAASVEELVQAYVGLVLGDQHLDCSLTCLTPNPEATRRYIRGAVRIFLHGAG